ncbi:MAG: bifunctional lysylphosphatidylglycerol flippase/synthetase MprF, partial [Phycisphaerae bacterium]|nr:bifunctional lysylphosphatidylglycerol flippase/synthetase MprF [Phycisphaerae bacterium]
GLTLLAYLLLTCYDLLAVRYARVRVGPGKTMFASFLSYVFSNNVNLSVFGASAVRFRLYTAWGVAGVDVVKIIAFTTMTFWLGLMTVAGATFVIARPRLPAALHSPVETTLPIGVLFLALSAGYVVWCGLRRQPVRVRSVVLPVPSIAQAFVQVLLGAADWTLAGLILYTLLRANAPVTFGHVLAMYFLAQVVGLISHVPGGLGVFEGVMVVLLSPVLPAQEALAVLIAYRMIYYLLPLAVGAVVMGAYELLWTLRAWQGLERAVGLLGPAVMPTILAVLTFLAGAILLYSGATPAMSERLKWLEDMIPLTVLEASHLIGSVLGVCLLLLSRGLQRRLDGAYHLTVLVLAAAIVMSVLKGLDVEEAVVLLIVLVLLLLSRRMFYRRASLISQRFTVGWIVAIALVVGTSIALGVIAHKNVDYKNQLWWRFAFGVREMERTGDPSASRASASRALRATVGVLVAAMAFGLARLLRAAPPEPSAPRDDELATAARIAAESSCTTAYLALLGDKRLLFNDDRTAFIMYAVEGRCWIAMGDPVGPEPAARELASRFLELVDRHDDWPVFYQVNARKLYLYADCGLALLKLGEEARVPLADFSLEGRERKALRHYLNRALREGVSFEVVPPDVVPALMGELRAVSDAWLAGKEVREHGFSLGFYDEDYLKRLPLALVRREGQIVAFANIWPGGGKDKEELSIDLMRYLPDGPREVMDYMFIQLMLWGREQGYQYFNLGMAPLSGLHDTPVPTLWHRVGRLIFRYGENFFNFQGLRQFKEKFDPQWQPKYLACPGGLALPRIFTNLATLLGRGPRSTREE